MNIDYTTSIEFTYKFTGIPSASISYELKEAIHKFLEKNTSPKTDVISSDIDSQESSIVITTNVNFPQMKLYELKQAIPNMIEKIQDKHKGDEEMAKEFALSWDKKPLKISDDASIRMTDFVRNINKVHSLFQDCKRDKNWEGAGLYATDFEDLCDVFTLIEKSEYKEAYHEYRSLDTACREWVPHAVIKMLIDKAGM